MFSQQQLAHFTAFGYVVLPGLLDSDDAAALKAEVVTALGDAFGEVGRPPGDDGGIPGDYLPLSTEHRSAKR